MQSYKKTIDDLKKRIEKALVQLNVEEKKQKIFTLEAEVSNPEIWNNPENATQKNKQLANLKKSVEPWFILQAQVNDLYELIEMADESMKDEFVAQIKSFETDLDKLEQQLYLSGPFDSHNAIIRLSAGVGGTDAQDWTEMLERMYLRWSEKEEFESNIIERSVGEEAGIKSSVIEIAGPYAYGKLKSEHGVHRLVRLSPFNSDNLRQTSFALVEILPEIETPEEVTIDEKDLKIDVYRAGGHGGQSVNTTDSAVRLTHTPTGIVVAIQNERSQIKNKETALKILRSKLAQMQLEQHAVSISELRAGESANWGSQIRNYVLHPYSLVKDTRTKYETSDVESVLNGDINGFIKSYLNKKD